MAKRKAELSVPDKIEQYFDRQYRLNKIYFIINKQGQSIPFVMNPIQASVLKSLHKRNLILKARQLGMSTFSVLYLLDQCIWQPNTIAGIVSYSLEHAQHIFKRIIGHALDNLPKWFDAGVISRSAREISFSNGSFIRVDTSLRGGSYQKILVSEFGKTCARTPLKAEEVITGTLQAVPVDGEIIIESTGEGNEGYFADMVNSAFIRGNDDLSDMDYKLFFFPWYQEPSYTLFKDVPYPVDLTDYFDKLQLDCNITINQKQRNWYAQQKGLLGDKIKQEFPSTVSEAFLSTSDAYYFSALIAQAYNDSRCIYVNPYDALQPVYVALDIGVNHRTVMVFFQCVHGEIRIIDYYEDMSKGVDFYAKFLLQDKNYLYNTIYLPHDSARRDGLIVENSYEKEFRRIFGHTQTKFVVLKRTDKQIQINNAKTKLSRCVFNLTKVKPLLDRVSKYRKKWSEQYGKYLEDPYDDENADFADALMYALEAVNKIEVVGTMQGALEKHRNVVAGRSKMI